VAPAGFGNLEHMPSCGGDISPEANLWQRSIELVRKSYIEGKLADRIDSVPPTHVVKRREMRSVVSTEIKIFATLDRYGVHLIDSHHQHQTLLVGERLRNKGGEEEASFSICKTCLNRQSKPNLTKCGVSDERWLVCIY
jgi:hypothetical protein